MKTRTGRGGEAAVLDDPDEGGEAGQTIHAAPDCHVRGNQSVPRIAAYRGRFVTPTPRKTSFGKTHRRRRRNENKGGTFGAAVKCK